MQRRSETGTKKYTKIYDQRRKDGGYAAMESMMPTHKSMSLDYYETYLEARRDLVIKLAPFYELPFHNKFKWNRYMNTQRSEAKFINKFTTTYGKDTAVIIGDWSDGGHTRRYQSPTKGKGWRKVFRRHHFDCYILDEHRTSALCPLCEKRVESLLWRVNPRPWKRTVSPFRTKGKDWKEVHGLLCCKNTDCTEQGSTLWNRDVMSTENMLKIVYYVLEYGERPSPYRRGFDLINS